MNSWPDFWFLEIYLGKSVYWPIWKAFGVEHSKIILIEHLPVSPIESVIFQVEAIYQKNAWNLNYLFCSMTFWGREFLEENRASFRIRFSNIVCFLFLFKGKNTFSTRTSFLQSCIAFANANPIVQVWGAEQKYFKMFSGEFISKGLEEDVHKNTY